MLSKKYVFLVLFFISRCNLMAQQPLSLRQAVETAIQNYGTIKAKGNYAAASKVNVEEARRESLPNLNFGAQQDYGTVNGQTGPLYGFGGLSVASSGTIFAQQNSNAAFGALYLTNINWDFFAFGRAKERVKAAQATAIRDEKDWQQEVFQQKIRVAAIYLNLLAARQLTRSYEKNLERADTFRRIVTTRVLNGLIAGVDSSQAIAEYSAARILLTNAKDNEESQSNQLSQLMGVPPRDYILDSFFVSRVPVILQDTIAIEKHPLLQWYQSRITVSQEQSRYYKTLYFPAFTLVGVLQTRGSGFNNDYASTNDYNKSYWSGINPTHTNYLFGVGVTWNITQPYRVSQQVKAQNLISKGLQDEYGLADQQVRAQLQLSGTRINNALSNYREVPRQVSAASDAYIQRSTLYKNGLTNLVDVTQAAYALIRAETDRDVAYNNVWQALLLKAAAEGDFSLFESQL